MKVLILEDEITHQVRMETTLAEIAKEMGITIKVKITGKVREFKEYIENDEVNQLYFLDIDIKGEETKGLEIAKFIRHHNLERWRYPTPRKKYMRLPERGA